MDQSCPGKVAAIDVKIKIDIPLPTPRSVINSPNHIITDVPAVITAIMVIILCHEVSGIIGSAQFGKIRPSILATAIKPVDCKIANPIVR